MVPIHFAVQPGAFAGDNRRFDMRFRLIGREDADIGQLVAVQLDSSMPEEPAVIPLTKPGVDFGDVDAVIACWQDWALIGSGSPTVSLDLILARLDVAGLAWEPRS